MKQDRAPVSLQGWLRGICSVQGKPHYTSLRM
jgi:hypothetical protein